MKEEIIRLETDRLIIQTPERAFIGKIVNYLTENRNFFEPWMPATPPDFYRPELQKKILREDIELINNGSHLKFYIFRNENSDRIIGDFTFSNILRGPVQSCFLGYKLAQSENNKGFMTEALHNSIDYVFKVLRLHRIEANIIPRNHPSIRVIEKLNFVKEGYSEKLLKINGNWEDHIRYAKLNPGE